MGLLVSREDQKEIISEKSLYAIYELIEFLKNNVRAEGLFQRRGRARRRRKILASLRRGDRAALRPMLDGATAAVESAAALQLFLTRLRRPLIPPRVQRLVLAENDGVPEHTVASDALGLLAQETSGRHLELLAALLDLLHVATRRVGAASELRGCALPVLLLPMFFDLKPSDCAHWKRVAATFDEVISTAPEWLRSCEHLLRPPCTCNSQSQRTMVCEQQELMEPREMLPDCLEPLAPRLRESHAEENFFMVTGVALRTRRPMALPASTPASIDHETQQCCPGEAEHLAEPMLLLRERRRVVRAALARSRAVRTRAALTSQALHRAVMRLS